MSLMLLLRSILAAIHISAAVSLQPTISLVCMTGVMVV
jgi:hypothetical protein